MTILAHGIGGRSDLPIPLWMAVYGGAAAVLISFFALSLFWIQYSLLGVMVLYTISGIALLVGA